MKALLFLPVFLAACASTGGPMPGADAPSGPKTDRLVIAFRQTPFEASTPRKVCCFDAYQHRPTHESLVGGDPKTGAPTVPTLATEWKLDEAGRAVSFKLRQGVQFHNNHGEMTAKDVVYTWESLVANEPAAGPTMMNWVLNWWRPNVIGAVAKGDYEVEFTIVPQAQFWYFISDVFNQMPIRSKAQFDKEGEPKDIDSPGAAGTGPYQWKDRKTSSHLRVERVPYKHWRAQPDFPEMEIRFVNEPSTRLAALLAGEVHITDVPNDLIGAAERSGMKRVENLAPGPRVMAAFTCCFVDPQTRQWPYYPDSALLNIKVREALNRAVNREELGKAFAPRRAPLHVNHFHPQRPGWDASFESRFNAAYGYNPDRAKQLLAEAGYSAANPLEIEMVVPQQLTYIANGADINDALANYFRNIGVKVNLLQIDNAGESAMRNQLKFKQSVRLQSIGGNILDGLLIWNLGGTGVGNYGYLTPELFSMRDELNRTMDPEKQVPILKRIGEFGFSNYWDIPLWYVPLEVMVNPQIVSGWTYPGTANGGWSHFELITAAR